MSLSVFNPLPDQQRRIDELTRALRSADERGDRLEGELLTERRKNKTIEGGVAELRKILAPLYHALGMVFGQIDAMGIQGEPGPSASAPKNSAAWESWKQKMGPNSAAAKIIDILMIHGKLNNTQIRIHLGTSRMQTVYDAISKLNKASLLNKNGDEFSLKEL
jgi:hypothetical protein